MKSTRKLLIAASVVSLAMALTACGSNNNDAAPVQTTPAASASENIVAVASGNPEFTTLVAAVKAADLVDTLQGAGPFTVLAPTNAAFAALPAGVLDALLKPENKATLAKILTYHVIAGNVVSGDVKAGPVNTVEGSPVTFAVAGTEITVAGSTSPPAKVVIADVKASNGTIHAIDGVLIPPGVDPASLVS